MASPVLRRNYPGWELHPMPCFVIFLMLGYSYLSLTFYIPMLARYQSRHWSVAMFALCAMDTLLTLTAYLQAVFLDPGPVPADWNAAQQKRVPFCGKCQEFKPERTHHCSHCHRCVLRYDHHCDWIDNCVGHINHKVFFLFLFYITIATIHYQYLVIMLVLNASQVLAPEAASAYFMVHSIIAILFTMLVFPLSFLAVSFLFWTTYLIVTNNTSLEKHTDESYDSGFVTNVTEVMGEQISLWFWPSPRCLTPDMIVAAPERGSQKV